MTNKEIHRVSLSLWERAGVREIQSVDPDGNNAKGREFAELEVPWLLARGTHWQLSPVKRHFEVLLGKMLQPEKRSPKDVEVPYLKAQHLQWDKVVTQDLPTMWATPEEVSSLRPRTAKLDELITVAECAIHLTQERRTSLIAAAVTGQIRVG